VGDSPFDMLRYDACYPAKESEARNLEGEYDADLRDVLLIHDGDRHWQPTRERWRSFGWVVEAVTPV